MSELALHARATQHGAMSPRLQRAVRLLHMSSQDFLQAVRDHIDSNPFLKEDEASPPSAPWEGIAVRGAARDDDFAPETVQAHTSLASHLLGQLAVLPLPPRDRALAEAIVLTLEEDGYLRAPLSDAGEAARLSPAADEDELAIALRRVQSLDPPGVGARDLAECLVLQAGAIPCPQVRAMACRLLKDHQRVLASRDLRAVARAVGGDLAQVQAACAALRRLDPKPGWRFASDPPGYLVPDVIVRRSRGRWLASLNEAVVPRLRVNGAYARLLGREAAPALSAQVQEARWAVRNVQQRFTTILQVAQAILDRQPHFLSLGAMALKPLALREIAEAVGVHESTVSRATHDKYMATPAGVFELRHFFSRAMPAANGSECSAAAIRGLVAELVAQEDKARPMSDVDLARALQQQGLQVARRTVTKYRQMLRLAPVEQRRLEAAR